VKGREGKGREGLLRAMGIVDVVSEFCSLPRTRRHLKKRKQFQVYINHLLLFLFGVLSQPAQQLNWTRRRRWR
jgi:hypothetical protein